MMKLKVDSPDERSALFPGLDTETLSLGFFARHFRVVEIAMLTNSII